MNKKCIMYARKEPVPVRGHKYSNLGHSERLVRRFRDLPIIKVLVRQHGRGKYYGWWDNRESRFNHVHRNRAILQMCFPYNIKDCEKRGDGKLMRVCVKEVREVKKRTRKKGQKNL